MKLVMTLVVRDEADIVDAQLAYHLNAGVDFVLATDHGSRDGTTEILESYEREGYLRLFREQGEMRESDWRTRMARLAATEYGADWVINTDADEFWMPRRGRLKDALGAIPPQYGIVWALTRHFVPRPEDGSAFAERMTARVSLTAPLNDPTSPYRPHAKAAHRADPEIIVLFGSHDVRSPLARLPNWYPADVLHFPFRTLAQWERKGSRRARGDKPLGQYVRASQASERGRAADLYRLLVLDDASVARGEREGAIVVDTRLRAALRDGQAPVAREARDSAGTVADELLAAAEGAALLEANLVRIHRRLDLLGVRIARAEHRRPFARVRRRLTHVGRSRDRTSAP